MTAFPELILNGNFEGDDVALAIHGLFLTTLERNSAEKHGGNYSAHIIGDDGISTYPFRLRIELARPYSLVFWYKLISGSFVIWDSLLNFNQLCDILGVWTEVSIPFTAIVQGNNAILYFTFMVPGEFYLDDLSFKRTTFIPSYLVVDQPGAGHGPAGHTVCGHGTVIRPKEEIR